MKPNRPGAQVRIAWSAITLIAIGLFSCAWLNLAQAQTTDASPSLRERVQEKIKARRAARQDKADSAPSLSLITQPGNYNLTLQHGGRERAYLVHIPTGYRSDKPAPVVFAFHGGGGNMQLQAGEHYGLVDKSDSAGFIAVFPNGYSRLPSGNLATWNAGTCCAQARDEGIDDVGFVRAIWDKLPDLVSVDRQRVYATGMSNGGMMSYRLACEMADVFKAIAPVAGTDNTLQCQPSRPISVLHIHAQDDDHVLFNGGAGEAAGHSATSAPARLSEWSVCPVRTAMSARRVPVAPRCSCASPTPAATLGQAAASPGQEKVRYPRPSRRTM